jgi:hypothetical protein
LCLRADPFAEALRCQPGALWCREAVPLVREHGHTYSRRLALQETNDSAVAAPQPSVFAGSGGAVTACNVDTGTTAIDCHARYFIV